ncbi:PucR family transcriptional regulator [Actinomadura craniellae]|uniref:PucR family transcriptional regulator n=2 Tax=Actinomadura craniellae TaxID=2231787 RepID=A0A365GWW2_9ACTN|nr:PucR family transcriptional regulator [Actinomadura craniellae]
MPSRYARLLRPYFDEAADEMVDRIQERVPEYDRPAGSDYARKMRHTVRSTVSQFAEVITREGADWEPLLRLYARIGAYEARKGNSLENLQTALRMSGRIACRRFTRDADRLDWPPTVLIEITEALFAFLDTISNAAAMGYDSARAQLANEKEHYRRRLRDALMDDPPASPDLITNLATAAGWQVPRSVAVVAVLLPAEKAPPIMPPELLPDWEAAVPYLVLPDPDGPGRDRLLAGLAGLTAAIGPAMPPTRAAASLRWARQALDCAERGALRGGLIRCMDHVPTLLAAAGRDLVDSAVARRLAPLLELSDARRTRLVPTMLAYLESGHNAVVAAERLGVHQQTIRYRLRRIEELFGDTFTDPDHQLELQLLLHTLVRLS